MLQNRKGLACETTALSGHSATYRPSDYYKDGAPILKEYQETVKHNVVTKCRREDIPYKEANRRVNKEVCEVTY